LLLFEKKNHQKPTCRSLIVRRHFVFSESLACDEAELGPDGLRRKLEAARLEQEQERAKLLQQAQAQAAAMSPSDFAADLQQRFGSLTPEQIATIRAMAAGRAAEQAQGLSDADVMSRAMSKLMVCRVSIQPTNGEAIVDPRPLHTKLLLGGAPDDAAGRAQRAGCLSARL
jgi:hypothetical protein